MINKDNWGRRALTSHVSMDVTILDYFRGQSLFNPQSNFLSIFMWYKEDILNGPFNCNILNIICNYNIFPEKSGSNNKHCLE